MIKELKERSELSVLMLDNVESFWFDHEIQLHARTILRRICCVRAVKLLLIARRTERPNITVGSTSSPRVR